MFGFTVVFDTQQMLPQHWLQKYSGLKTMYVSGIESLLLGRMSLSYGADLFYVSLHVVYYVYMSRDTYARVLCFLAMTAWLFLPSSRQTQWDPPTWESPGDDASLEHEAEMDLGTPTYDENPMKVSVAYRYVS